MNTSKSPSLPPRRQRGSKPTSKELGHSDERARQLADIAATGSEDAAECAAADLFREFAPLP